MAILEVQDIHTYYGDAYVLQGLSLTLEQGQILGLLGRNGVGKTTLVNSIVGFNPPRRGKIVFKGVDITGISSFEAVRTSPLNKSADAFSARCRGSTPCTRSVTCSASARCASRRSGSCATLRASSAIRGSSRNVKNFRYLTTSRSSVFSQNW